MHNEDLAFGMKLRVLTQSMATNGRKMAALLRPPHAHLGFWLNSCVLAPHLTLGMCRNTERQLRGRMIFFRTTLRCRIRASSAFCRL